MCSKETEPEPVEHSRAGTSDSVEHGRSESYDVQDGPEDCTRHPDSLASNAAVDVLDDQVYRSARGIPRIDTSGNRGWPLVRRSRTHSHPEDFGLASWVWTKHSR